jgi:MerR family Zn(II)-responsive transcriptional regulator of zntA
MQSGELANLAGVSTDTLRHYERMGLLRRPQRTESGYRQYTPQSLERVRLIRRALSVGFSLAELTAILKMRDNGEVPCNTVRKIAESKLQTVKHQITDLIAMRDQLESILKDWNSMLAHTPKGVPARLLESLRSELPRASSPSPLKIKHTKEGRL